jgi:hypothetical protein
MLARLSETLRLLLLFTRRKEEAKRGRERGQTGTEEIQNFLAPIKKKKK